MLCVEDSSAQALNQQSAGKGGGKEKRVTVATERSVNTLAHNQHSPTD